MSPPGIMMEHGFQTRAPLNPARRLAMGRHPGGSCMCYSCGTRLHIRRTMDDGRSLVRLRFRRSTRYTADARIAVTRTCRSADARRVLARCDVMISIVVLVHAGKVVASRTPLCRRPAAHSRPCLHAVSGADDSSNSVGPTAASMTPFPRNRVRNCSTSRSLLGLRTHQRRPPGDRDERRFSGASDGLDAQKNQSRQNS